MPTRRTPPKPATMQNTIAIATQTERQALDDELEHFAEAIEGSFDPRAKQLEGIAVGFDDAIRKAQANEELNDLGRQRARDKVARDALTQITALETESLRGWRTIGDQLRAELTQPEPAPTDPTVVLRTELRAREIRDQVRGLDPLVRDLLYETTTDPAVIAALDTAPPALHRREEPGGFKSVTFEPLVSPDVKTRVAQARAEARKPEVAAKLAELAQLDAAFRGMFNAARQYAQRYVASEPARAAQKK